jgi:hypothetical protein
VPALILKVNISLTSTGMVLTFPKYLSALSVENLVTKYYAKKVTS